MGCNMKNITRFLCIASMIAVIGPKAVRAAEGPVVSASVMPYRFVNVKGDAQKFRELKWTSDGSDWGLKDLSVSQKFKNDINVEFEGSSTPGDKNVDLDLLISKEGKGFTHLKYDLFQKYYSNSGGFYNRFSTLSINKLQNDLSMAIGHLEVETGTAPEGEPGVILGYERHTKNGAKSRLTWTSVKEGAITRKTGPSWQDITESANAIVLKANALLAGLTVDAEQKAEFVKSRNVREEKNIATTTNTSDSKLRIQTQEPMSNMYTSTLRASKWMMSDKVYGAMGYRLEHLRNREHETTREFNDSGAPFNYTNPETKLNAVAKNAYDNNIWNGQLVFNPAEHWSLMTKVKGEVANRRGDSTYPGDSTAGSPDGIINTTEVSHVENKNFRFGESFSIRYDGLPRTSVYAEADMEQSKNWISEERVSIAGQSAANTSENFDRETVVMGRKNSWTVGTRSVPVKFLTFTTQLRQRFNDANYNDKSEYLNSTTARSAFTEYNRTRADEATARIAIRPIDRLETGFRYQYVGTKYHPKAEGQSFTKSWSDSNTLTWDTNLTATDNLFLSAAYSRQLFKMVTPAAGVAYTATSGYLPAFTANVDSVLLSANYVIKKDLSLSNSFLYSRADNFNDYSPVGLPLGVDNSTFDYTTGVKWEPKKDLTIEPHYSYYYYKVNPDAGVGSYVGQVAWIDVNLKF